VSLLLKIQGGTVVTMNDTFDVVQADVLVDGGRIARIGALDDVRTDVTVDARDQIVLPGFIQTHIHLCQTLFRGRADDLPLLAWLQQRVWPLEAAHTPASLRASARLAAAELLLGGTTTVLTMETVHDTDAVFDALIETGIRAIVGKCLMDVHGEAPPRLYQGAQAAIDEALDLHARWHGRGDGRLSAAIAPRFAISCTRDLLEAAAAAAATHDLLVHTHASEQREEVNLVRTLTGLDNLEYLAQVGLATPRVCAAHCVWTTEAERAILAERDVKVLHCPGSNLKLGSGIAPVVDLRARGICVSLGADGAACNNSLDMFHEMRLAATLQAVQHGPGALTARDVVWMATREGARAIGRPDDLGAIEVGRRADIIVVDPTGLHQQPWLDPYSLLVYACRPTDVSTTVVDGRIVARRGELSWADRREVAAEAAVAARQLAHRAGLL
jgi:5-methylthioadenosine/S-adenosylhomocysteine deaminase